MSLGIGLECPSRSQTATERNHREQEAKGTLSRYSSGSLRFLLMELQEPTPRLHGGEGGGVHGRSTELQLKTLQKPTITQNPPFLAHLHQLPRRGILHMLF